MKRKCSSYILVAYFMVMMANVVLGSQGRSAEDGSLLLKSKDLKVELNASGQLSSVHGFKNTSLLLNDKALPFVQIKKYHETGLQAPKTLTWKEICDGYQLEFKFESTKLVMVTSRYDSHINFEVISVSGDEIEELVWGPYNVNLDAKIAESLGAVSNLETVFGFLSLNIKTTGGYYSPDGDNKVNTAAKLGEGARLMAQTYNRSKNKLVTVVNHKNIHCIATEEEPIVGAKVALYSCSEQGHLDQMKAISLAECLPMPIRAGVWLKESKEANTSKLISDFTQDNFDDFLALAIKTGIKCIYHNDVFESWGNYKVNKTKFPGGMAELKKCVAKAKRHGINLGTHTLSNFITPNDPLITPIPHRDLLKAGSATLAIDLDETSDVIQLNDEADVEAYTAFVRGQKRAVQIGQEIVEFSSCSTSKPYVLRGCQRGAFGTRAARHEKGALISKLPSHVYGTFFPNMKLQDQMAKNLAAFFNESGFKRLSFDGLEGCQRTGHGFYSEERFVKKFYDHLNERDVIINASRLTHFAWHYQSNESWGEPWYSSFRKSMLDYRLNMHDFLVRNLMPPKLGQFKLTKDQTPEDIDWLMGLSCGLSAGIDLYISSTFQRDSVHAEEILNKIKVWEEARLDDVFSEQVKHDLRNPDTIYSIQKSADGFNVKFEKDWKREEEELIEKAQSTLKKYFIQKDDSVYALSHDHVHINKKREPGQPTDSIWMIKNPSSAYPLDFVLRADADNTEVGREIFIKMGALKYEMPCDLKPGEALVINGRKAKRYAKDDRMVAEYDMPEIVLPEGETAVSFNNDRGHSEQGPKLILNFYLKK